ncbi:MAG: class I SAM-dependent methyltransferase [Pseudomonadota bacterium]
MSKNQAESERLQALAEWWRGDQGSTLCKDESAAMEYWLARCFGYHALHLALQPVGAQGEASATCPLAGLRIPHAFRLGPLSGQVRARFESLPLEAESVDLVVAQHVLELASDPHALLREVDRVLIPEGRVVLLSFNPASFWWLRRLFNYRDAAPWFGEAPGRKRLRDWLGLLGYELEAEAWVGHGYSFQADSMLAGFIQRWLARWLPSSGMAQLILARKRVSMPAPIRHRWRLMPGFSVVKPGQAVGASPQSRGHCPRHMQDGHCGERHY